jgi:15-cis-phytoene synthase
VESRELEKAYARCRRMQLRHDPTFFWATRRLPRDVRPAVHAVYGYVRYADELVDGPRRPADPAGRRAALDGWERCLEDGRAAGRSDQPIVAALVDAERRHDLPLDELRVYMRSMRVDCGPVRIRSREELDDYMNGSAAAVGRIMAPLLGCTEREQMAALGVAFQLTNFIRDVREDWTLDRVYLPGLPEDDLARGEAGSGARERVAAEVARARALFAATTEVPERCDRAMRPGMRMARAVYERVLDRVERVGFDVVRGRAALAPWEVARAAAGGLRAAP